MPEQQSCGLEVLIVRRVVVRGSRSLFNSQNLGLPQANRIRANGMGEIAPQIEDLPSNRFDTVYLHHHTPIPPEPASYV
jgi:hypothetical protein